MIDKVTIAERKLAGACLVCGIVYANDGATRPQTCIAAANTAVPIWDEIDNDCQYKKYQETLWTWTDTISGI